MLERLQKIIARAGIASRRHAEELIRSGQVRVNGSVVTELGAKADPDHDRVEAAGQIAQRPAQLAYYILYKPPHVVATMSDPEGRATLRHLLRGLAGGVFPVGRLDYAASGLLFLTSDGVLADRMLKAAARIPKVYWIKVKGALGHDLLRDLGHRAHARMRPLRGPAAAKKYADNPWYEVELNDARHEVLQSALFAAGHPVEKLKRVQVGPLELGKLAEGHYRELDSPEVARLRGAIERAEKAPRPISKPSQIKRWTPAIKRGANGDANRPQAPIPQVPAPQVPTKRHERAGEAPRPISKPNHGEHRFNRPNRDGSRGASRGANRPPSHAKRQDRGPKRHDRTRNHDHAAKGHGHTPKIHDHTKNRQHHNRPKSPHGTKNHAKDRPNNRYGRPRS